MCRKASGAHIEEKTICRTASTYRQRLPARTKANFNKEIGRTVARRNALNQVWPLEGYLLKQRIFEEDGA